MNFATVCNQYRGFLFAIARRNFKASTLLPRLCSILVFCALVFASGAAHSASPDSPQTPLSGQFTDQLPDGRLRVSVQLARPFQGEISQEMARAAALSAARIEAMRQAEHSLAGLEELRLMLNSQGQISQPDTVANTDPGAQTDTGPDARADAEAAKNTPTANTGERQIPGLNVFGYALLRQEHKFEESVGGLPPRLLLELRCAFVSPSQMELRDLLVHLFKNPALLENYALAAQLEQESLAAYDRAAQHLLSLPPAMPVAEAAGPGTETTEVAGPGTETTEVAGPGTETTEVAASEQAAKQRALAVEELQKAYNALQGARAYLTLLPELYADSGLHAELLKPLEQAAALLPDNFLLQSEAGRLYLWLELNAKATEALDKAIALNPDFAQPYAHRGALWLLLQRPALALDDLSRAIKLDPQNPDYYYGRAVVHQVAGDGTAMCKDLEKCCLLGDCEPYEWAMANSSCP